ncbi:unnamed protein product [Bemisia tabaci]|uniref:Uncharacterized protein n=1 Tax=Bemisia tabaci TaxID=7038 RepID=A0A9P0AJN9_BEMTA|nr:unnamed protein product [Bemisia tabaci]
MDDTLENGLIIHIEDDLIEDLNCIKLHSTENRETKNEDREVTQGWHESKMECALSTDYPVANDTLIETSTEQNVKTVDGLTPVKSDETYFVCANLGTQGEKCAIHNENDESIVDEENDDCDVDEENDESNVTVTIKEWANLPELQKIEAVMYENPYKDYVLKKEQATKPRWNIPAPRKTVNYGHFRDFNLKGPDGALVNWNDNFFAQRNCLDRNDIELNHEIKSLIHAASTLKTHRTIFIIVHDSVIPVAYDMKISSRLAHSVWAIEKLYDHYEFPNMDILNEQLLSEESSIVAYFHARYMKLNVDSHGPINSRITSSSRKRTINARYLMQGTDDLAKKRNFTYETVTGRFYYDFTLIIVRNGKIAECAIHGVRSNILELVKKYDPKKIYCDYKEGDSLHTFLNYPYQPLYEALRDRMVPLHLVSLMNGINQPHVRNRELPFCDRRDPLCSFCRCLCLLRTHAFAKTRGTDIVHSLERKFSSLRGEGEYHDSAVLKTTRDKHDLIDIQTKKLKKRKVYEFMKNQPLKTFSEFSTNTNNSRAERTVRFRRLNSDPRRDGFFRIQLPQRLERRIEDLEPHDLRHELERRNAQAVCNYEIPREFEQTIQLRPYNRLIYQLPDGGLSIRLRKCVKYHERSPKKVRQFSARRNVFPSEITTCKQRRYM